MDVPEFLPNAKFFWFRFRRERFGQQQTFLDESERVADRLCVRFYGFRRRGVWTSLARAHPTKSGAVGLCRSPIFLATFFDAMIHRRHRCKFV